MKLFAPNYYKDFKCIADKCTHSCCVNWEIDIDDETQRKYKSLTEGYGADIIKSISSKGTPHFKLGKGKRCPHLDKRGLCKIILNLGEGYLCDICREHPRFYNFTSVCEVGLGISCPEAARIILTSDNFYETQEIGEVDAADDETLFDGRLERQKAYKILRDNFENLYQEYNIDVSDDSHYLSVLDSMEYLRAKHKGLFMKYSGELRPFESEINEYLKRFLAYLIFRHCTEAFDSEDFSSRLRFCLFCERLLASLICTEKAKTLDEVINLAVAISEEIEYSEENTLSLTYID